MAIQYMYLFELLVGTTKTAETKDLKITNLGLRH